MLTTASKACVVESTGSKDCVAGEVRDPNNRRLALRATRMSSREWPISGASFKLPKSRTLAHSRVVSERDGALSARCPTHR